MTGGKRLTQVSGAAQHEFWDQWLVYTKRLACREQIGCQQPLCSIWSGGVPRHIEPRDGLRRRGRGRIWLCPHSRQSMQRKALAQRLARCLPSEGSSTPSAQELNASTFCIEAGTQDMCSSWYTVMEHYVTQVPALIAPVRLLAATSNPKPPPPWITCTARSFLTISTLGDNRPEDMRFENSILPVTPRTVYPPSRRVLSRSRRFNHRVASSADIPTKPPGG